MSTDVAAAPRRPRSRWWLAAFFLVPFALSFVPGLPAHGYGHLWFLLPVVLLWRRPERRVVLAWFAAGWILQTLAYPEPDFGVLGWLLLVPYLLARDRTDGDRTDGDQADGDQPDGGRWWRAAFCYGLIRAHAGFAWLGQVHYAAWIGVSLLSGLAFVLAFEAVLRLGRRLPYGFRVASAWVFFEWVHSWFFGGLPWLQLGHTQYRHVVVIQIAAIVGPFGVSFLMAYVQASALAAFRDRRRLEPAFAATLLAAALAYGFAADTPADRGPKVLMVQTAARHLVKPDKNVRRGSDWAVLTRRTREGLAAHPDAALVIWPETMHPFRLIENHRGYSHDFWRTSRQMARLHRRPFLYGINTYTTVEQARSMRGHNSAVLVGADGQLKGIYRKQDLVPMGEEFLPRRVLPDAVCDRLFRKLVDGGYPGNADLEAGTGHATLDAGDGLKGAALICFEGLYPGLARDAVRHGPCDYILHLVNNGWFGVSWEQRQMVASLVFRAIETRTPVLSCANGGITVAIGPSGRELARIDRVMKDGYLGVEVPRRGAPTPFLRWESWILLGAILALGGLTIALSHYGQRRWGHDRTVTKSSGLF